MQLTLWGEFVNDPGSMLEQEFTAGKHPIVAVRAVCGGLQSFVRLSDYAN